MATGRTVNISSHGVLITSAFELPPGTLVAVVIAWPILLRGLQQLALHIQGTVVRSNHGLIALKFSIYEFRIQAKPRHKTQGSHK